MEAKKKIAHIEEEKRKEKAREAKIKALQKKEHKLEK